MNTVVRRLFTDNGVRAVTVRVGGNPRALAATRDALWVGDAASGSPAHVDARITRVTKH